MSKIFKRLILNRIIEIEDENDVDLTGKNQHGFKRNHSTATAGLSIQSKLARAMDKGKYGAMASLDLSAAFDLVNVNLLINRLQIIGLPQDLVNLIKIWLSNRLYYVSIDGANSY